MGAATVADTLKSGKIGPLDLMRAIREADMPAMRKLVLFMLVTYAHREGGGGIHPALATVAEKTGLNVRTVRRHVSGCRNAGILVELRRSHGRTGSEYRMSLDALKALNPDSGVRVTGRVNPDSGAPNPDSDDPQPGHPSPPTCSDLILPTAPTVSAGEGQPAGAGDELWRRKLLEPRKATR